MKVQEENLIETLFIKWHGKAADSIDAIAPSGSPRKYFRISYDSNSVVAAYNPDLAENNAFLYLTKHFHASSLPVPEVLAEDRENGVYLLSDLGDSMLSEAVMGRENLDRIPEELYKSLAKTIRMLAHFQVKGGKGLDYSICYPREAFDRQSMMWDLNYFKYYILKTSGITFNEQLLENDFNKFCDFLLEADNDYFMYRDFQSRNVMMKEGNPCFIDFQGGRKGALQYDLASFLYQVKAYYPEETKDSLIHEYLDELSTLGISDKAEFMKYFYPFVFLRLFQVLGAYGFRGSFEKRPHFAESLVPAMASLSKLLSEQSLGVDLPELKSALEKLTQNSKYSPRQQSKSTMEADISSFAFKHGIPEDNSGNHGGFVFDCRVLPNPGRLEEYKKLNGRDPSVKAYLARYKEVDNFLHNVYEIIDAGIENYIERGFTHLSINFGCTGGQHRSVYCADRLAEHLAKKYVINIKLLHREQEISETK